ncbi:hypothetical protein [Hymenobacter metallicola]|uniref:Uncharacterized protein n=1 Tax=Hymenobacter metallicola TaxID=2563114 RepID=A0A4Z0PTL6_9BACT|nr:hypothetical protein [Hymenobacter metallicola]TGE21120.1 hypothetical protein E5K02_24215 [Hymenobacter metallicola]
MNTSPFAYAEVINVLIEGLRMALFSKEQITQWADGFILHDAQPDIFFIDLALSRTREEALTILSETARTMAAETSPRPLLCAIYERLVTNDKTALESAASLGAFIWNNELLTVSERNFIQYLHYDADMLDLLPPSAREKLEQDIGAFLALYKEYTIENYAGWDSLDQEIVLKLDTTPLFHNDTSLRNPQVMPAPKPILPVRKPRWQFWK